KPRARRRSAHRRTAPPGGAEFGLLILALWSATAALPPANGPSRLRRRARLRLAARARHRRARRVRPPLAAARRATRARPIVLAALRHAHAAAASSEIRIRGRPSAELRSTEHLDSPCAASPNVP